MQFFRFVLHDFSQLKPEKHNIYRNEKGKAMGKNLFDFANERIDDEEINRVKKEAEESIDDETKATAKDLYEKYKNYSKEDLADEFVSASKSKIKQGKLTTEKIKDTLQKLSPYISDNQKKFLEDLLSKINE